ncbi:MAG: hypothetical protein EXR70_14525 [Deltaproteobacteria bacterium]|nr:hypothetical protein [Deltaproteobacteria bacterium]
MLLLRLLLLFAILYIIYLVVKGFITGARKHGENASNAGEPMVLDPQCQTYVPKADAVARAGKFFCSEECSRLYLAR